VIKCISYTEEPLGAIVKTSSQIRKDMRLIKGLGFNSIKLFGPGCSLENITKEDFFNRKSKVWAHFKKVYNVVNEFFPKKDIYTVFLPYSFPFEDTSVEEFVEQFMVFYDIVKGSNALIYNELSQFSTKFKGKFNKVDEWLPFVNESLEKLHERTGDKKINYSVCPREFLAMMDAKKRAGLLKYISPETRKIYEETDRFMDLIPYWFVNIYYCGWTKDRYKSLIEYAREISGKDFLISEFGCKTYDKKRAFNIGAEWTEKGEYNEEGQAECLEEVLDFFKEEMSDKIMGFILYSFDHHENDSFGIYRFENGKAVPKKSVEIIKKKLKEF